MIEAPKIEAPTEEEQRNWQTFYDTMEKYTRKYELEYDGRRPFTCLIGITSRELEKENREYGRLVSGFRHRFALDAEIEALAMFYHVDIADVSAIYQKAALEEFRNDLGAALDMALAELTTPH